MTPVGFGTVTHSRPNWKVAYTFAFVERDGHRIDALVIGLDSERRCRARPKWRRRGTHNSRTAATTRGGGAVDAARLRLLWERRKVFHAER